MPTKENLADRNVTTTELAAVLGITGRRVQQLTQDGVLVTASRGKFVLSDLVMNDKTQHYDIYAKVGDKMELLDDTTVNLSGYVQKETGKGLSTNDYTTAEKTKLAGIADGANKYVHPTHTAAASGLYKVTVDALGHVTATTKVTKNDITALGIPGQDTTYPEATTAKAGLMSAADKSKLDGMTIASDADVTAMLTEVFGA